LKGEVLTARFEPLHIFRRDPEAGGEALLGQAEPDARCCDAAGDATGERCARHPENVTATPPS
jgi:hypothetical protein